jgi:quinol monooxygenase YgiN
MPVKIVAIIAPKSGREAELATLLDSLLVPSRAEPGNLRYDLWREPGEGGRYVFDELYADDAAVAAHRASPHFARYLAAIEGLAERIAVVAHPVDIA